MKYFFWLKSVRIFNCVQRRTQMNVKITIYFSVEEKCNHFTTLQDQHQTAHWWWLVECFPQVEFLLRRNTLFFFFFSTHYTPTSVCRFSIHLLRWWQGNIFWPVKSFFSWWPFPLFLWSYCLIQGWYCKEKLDVGHW